MSHTLPFEQEVVVFQIPRNQRVGISYKHPGPRCHLFRYLALFVDKLKQRKIKLLSQDIVIFPKGGSHVDDTRTVFQRNKVSINDEEGLFIYTCN